MSRKPIADSNPPHAILQLHGKSLIKEDLLSKPHRKKALCMHSLSGFKCMAVGECQHPGGRGPGFGCYLSAGPPVSGWGSKFHASYLPVHGECCSFTWSLLLEAKQRWARFTVGPEPGKRKWSPLDLAGKGRRHNRIGRMGCANDISACIARVPQPGLWSAVFQCSAC